ncbi:MAG: S-methyl-5'-thioinosine phosphorylase [Pseudomonadales bacterium]|nr:S-methyl-5'-thioinosine phosphorylase [Pseudomonadales bacterium]
MLAIIGGSGLYHFDEIFVESKSSIETPFGETSAGLVTGKINNQPVCFLPRHGEHHHLPPHKVNYRANIWALHHAGVSGIVAVNAVGGVHPLMGPSAIVVPDNIIDYTWGREHTFSDGKSDKVEHVDFTNPYDQELRRKLVSSAAEQNIEVVNFGVYAATQGPRLESAAEIRRIKNDGGDIVGMTGMPEASLARELDIPYACLSLVANWGAGITDELISIEDIHRVLEKGISDIRKIIVNIF